MLMYMLRCIAFRLVLPPFIISSISLLLYALHQQWNGFYFKQTSLQALGQHIQLGHDGAPCPSPLLSPTTSTVLHVNGIHSVYIDQCACQENWNINITAQFLRLGLWLATVLDPKTAATIQLLDFFHQLTLQSKVNLYDFYWTLSHLISCTDDSVVPVSIHYVSSSFINASSPFPL